MPPPGGFPLEPLALLARVVSIHIACTTTPLKLQKKVKLFREQDGFHLYKYFALSPPRENLSMLLLLCTGEPETSVLLCKLPFLLTNALPQNDFKKLVKRQARVFSLLFFSSCQRAS